MSALTTIPTSPIRTRYWMLALNLLNGWAYRGVLWMLALRDIKLRYRQTAFGIVSMFGLCELLHWIGSLPLGQCRK